MIPGLIITVIILVIISLYLLFFNNINSFFEKISFQKKLGRTIYQVARDNDYYLLNKVAIRIDGKTIHFDHIIFGDKYIYCIVKRYYSFALHGNYIDSSWFHYLKNGKFEIIKNPMKINQERINYFASAIASSKDIFVGIVLINDSCLIDEVGGSDANNLLLNRKSLKATIRRFERDESVEMIEPESLKALVDEVFKKCVQE